MASKEVIKVERAFFQKIETQVIRKGKLKVAAYARVSTEKEDQLHSLMAQKTYYTKLIADNKDWKFVGIFADEGTPGTSYKNRHAFNEMIDKAKSGDIDLIITKSVSRFARNTVDTLEIIRDLKAKDVAVYFEKENINTIDSKGEFIITLMSSLAQEESRSLSENVAWGQRKRFAEGKATAPFSRFLGYDMGENGEFVVNEKQARVVRAIFGMKAIGFPNAKILQTINHLDIPKESSKSEWISSNVSSILSNEKYKGDALLQKTFTVNFLTKEKRRMKGSYHSTM
ncbi:recombinase family protein [Erysipelothrix rhusiopathiae]|nr:recombinase family protein [Erysipelothrix rhusiopathiae]MDE8079898.1 recombinase family protein [Erysipelothrix rhusiopathiae]MDE8084479.1 recombinase family protein [Erysipelothrix rhusiopathiae]MDE8088029.1 recombinase family protein [Erysipelothrix rhusiopathiae]MDE8095023.1 recombinase family protein [Erysipelothrix rhusiopathiae]